MLLLSAKVHKRLHTRTHSRQPHVTTASTKFLFHRFFIFTFQHSASSTAAAAATAAYHQSTHIRTVQVWRHRVIPPIASQPVSANLKHTFRNSLPYHIKRRKYFTFFLFSFLMHKICLTFFFSLYPKPKGNDFLQPAQCAFVYFFTVLIHFIMISVCFTTFHHVVSTAVQAQAEAVEEGLHKMSHKRTLNLCSCCENEEGEAL